jgi:hypothetical protein
MASTGGTGCPQLEGDVLDMPHMHPFHVQHQLEVQVKNQEERPQITYNPRPGMRADAPACRRRLHARRPGRAGAGAAGAHCSCSLAASFSARRRSLRPRSCRVRSAVSAFISISRCAGLRGQARRASAAMQSRPGAARSTWAELRAAGQWEQVKRHARAAALHMQSCQS